MSSQSLSKNAQPAVTLSKSASFINDILNCFRSIHLAIVLLSLLAIGTIIGVVMPQEGMVEVADIQQKYGVNYKFFNTLGFFNVYSSFWFITLQTLFFFNLLVGSFKWLKPATLAAIQKNCLSVDLLQTKPDTHSLPQLVQLSKEDTVSQLKAILKRFRYGIHQDTSGNIYASKGNITRIGPSISHFGILLCLIAGLYSSFTGFKAVHMITPGNTFAIQESTTFKTNTPHPFWVGSVPEWKIRVLDFQAEFYKDHPEVAKQYFSKLQIVSPDEKKVLKEQTISVNHPLIYDNLSIYQASYAPTGRFILTDNSKPLTVSVNQEFNERPVSITPLADKSTLIMFPFFAGQDKGVKENYAVFFVRRPGEPFGEGQMPPNIRLKQGESGSLHGHQVTYIKPEMSTGLQIKRAPEVGLMYLSYIIIAIGATLCFFSQRQLWIAVDEVYPGKTAVVLHPKTNKGRLSFRKELVQLEQQLHKAFFSTHLKKEPTHDV
jgi:cytochrome c biogenesis protein